MILFCSREVSEEPCFLLPVFFAVLALAVIDAYSVELVYKINITYPKSYRFQNRVLRNQRFALFGNFFGRV